jgi:hypothetical protein
MVALVDLDKLSSILRSIMFYNRNILIKECMKVNNIEMEMEKSGVVDSHLYLAQFISPIPFGKTPHSNLHLRSS